MRLAWFIAISVILQSPPGQPPTARPGDLSGFARYVPASAKFFVTVRRLGEVNDALHRAHAWRLAPLLAGRPVEEGDLFDLRSAMVAFLGPETSVNIDELMSAEVGLAASDWSQISKPVWFVRVKDPRLVDRWFPPQSRKASNILGTARMFRTPDGLMVCTQDDVIAMARRWGRESVLPEVWGLMAGRGGGSLSQSAGFRELAAYMPAGHLAIAYTVPESRPPQAEGQVPSLWSGVDRAVIGLYEGQGRLEVAVRASLAVPHRKAKLASAAVDRLMQLPQTTLLAYAATIGFDKASYRPGATTVPTSGLLERYLAFLGGMRGSEGDSGPEALPRLGPNLILVWDQDLSEGGSTPQPAVLIECADGRAVHDFVRQIVEKLIQLARTIDRGESLQTPVVQREMHLGVPVMHVPLKAFAQRSELKVAKLLQNADPAWAIWDGWLILALSRDHVERILDAQYGLVPQLAAVSDVAALRKRPADRVVVSVVQPGLAAYVLDRWLAIHQSGAPSLLDPNWWPEGVGFKPPGPPLLGIGMRLDQEPGVVTVARVYSGTPAAGRLQPGDRILGIDRRLLSLASPNADLRALWAESIAEPGPTLRVDREGTAMDVVLPQNREERTAANLLIKPADAVREFASLGRALQFASFEVLASDQTHYSVRLSLRLVPGAAPEASPGG